MIGLAVEFPVKWVLAGNLVLPLDILPRQMGFGGESRAICGRFAPPKRFWPGISEYKQTKKAVSKPENSVLVLMQPLSLLFCLQSGFNASLASLREFCSRSEKDIGR